MDYYHCPLDQLRHEVHRRGYVPSGGLDQLSEGLKKDDTARGTDVSTISTLKLGPFLPNHERIRRNEFGQTVPASSLVNERIIYWTLNTFFPTLQLFFASGRSCTIEGSHLPSALIGLDSKLRFRLTDCTHEEQGKLVKTTMAEKFANSTTGIVIREACIAQRTSVAVKPTPPVPVTTRLFSTPSSSPASSYPTASIIHESHIVVGLRLEGMSKMGYIWAKVEGTPPSSPQKQQQQREQGSQDVNKTWGDVRIAGLRQDVPTPLFLGYPEQSMRAGGEATIVVKESLITGNTLQDDIEDFWRS